MNIKNVRVLILFIMGLLLVSACTSSPGSGSSAPVSTPAREPVPAVPVTTILTTKTQTGATGTTQPITVSTTTSAADAITHRYIKINSDLSAYEFTFYPSGDLNYRTGTSKQVFGDYVIDPVIWQGSGTWTALGNNKYLVKFLPVAVSGAPIVREYTLVPSHTDPEYPGITIAEHIESSYETSAINKGIYRYMDKMYLYYPMRAKND